MGLYPTGKNVGGWDRLLRLVVGPVLLIVALAAVLGAITLGPVVIAISAIVGVILTVTGLTQKCPLNQLLGVNTYKGKPPREAETESTERSA